jgi:hypothetical protein
MPTSVPISALVTGATFGPIPGMVGRRSRSAEKRATIVQSCVTDFLTSPSWLPNYCNDDSSVTANFTSAHVAAVRSAVAQALTVASAAERRPVHDERASRNSSGRGTWRR